jgi:drug/metabolite transporter (DMT)-like permease
LFLIPLALRERRRMSAPFRVLSYYNILAAAAFSTGLALQQISSGLTTATNMGFLVNSCAVAVPLILWLTGSGFPGGRVWIAAAAVMSGAALLSGFSTKFGSGDLLCLASAFSYALWTIAVGRAVTGNGAASTLTLFQLVICGIFSTSIALSLETPTLAQLWDFWPGLLYLGLCGTGIAFALSAHAQRFLPICAAAIIMNLEALFTAVFGHLLLGEILGGTAFLGGLMILGGCISVQIRR